MKLSKDVTRSLEASLALLQSTRLQKAAISLNEDLKRKFALESLKKQKFKHASIVSDQNFRAKVAGSGPKLEMEQMIQNHGDTIEKLLA